ncbi:MAG TPA: DOMON-like domain-containing protein [Sphingomicrobium sp.]|jgi:hypothetical protein|nr:DOMON-like domain-containing protein [Sphingomicrobium sp.]
MQFNLASHPTTPPSDPALKIWANIDHASSLGSVATTNIWFGVGAPTGNFVIPEAGDPGRKDELWATTCFEAFLQPEGQKAYREWNFAPSGDWAAYEFSAYRDGMAPADVTEPYVRMEDNFTWWALGATIAVDSEPSWRLGLAAVLEEKDGTKSYWALAHSNPDKPDFHLSDCFTAKLA